MIPFIYNVEIGTPVETESKLVMTRSCGKEEWRVTANEYGISLWGDENILEMRRWLHSLEIYSKPLNYIL